jgi:putative FmdB family regulatory protein
MPIYEYRCASCGHELEALQKISDAPLTVCPACHQAGLTKLVSAAGFQLKGSGWYVTDFRNSGAKPAAKEKPAGAANGDGNAAPAASSDQKPAPSKSETPAGDKTTATATSAPATTSSTKNDG